MFSWIIVSFLVCDFFEFLVLLEAMAMGMAVDTVAELTFPYWTPLRRRFPPDSPFFASGNVERELLARQYECLVEGCGLKFKNYKSRHRHLIDKHKFPTTFEFFKKTQPSKKQREKIQRQRVSKPKHKEEASSDAMEVEDKAIMDGLVSALSTLTTSDTTPSNVSFGRRHGRGLTFVPRSVRKEERTESSSAPGPTK